jgi:cell division protein FtsB
MAQNRIQHTFERLNTRPQNQVAALGILGLMIMLVFGGVYLSQVATFATTNRQIEQLIEERDQLERTNEQLRGRIAELQTIPRLLARAEELGFRPATAADIEYLVVEGYNPNRNRTVVPQSVDLLPNTAPQYDETFSGWVQQQFDHLRQQFQGFGGR